MKTSDLLTTQDLIPEVRKKVFAQSYEETVSIQDVIIKDLELFIEEDGDFGEVLRVSKGEVEGFPKFQIAQVNRTRLNPNATKAWHFHLKQDVLWYVGPMMTLFVGLWDIREKSSTRGMVKRVVLGLGKSRLLYIPHGVAHGSANFSTSPVNLFYFTTLQFNKRDHDEKRLPWDILGKSFWNPRRDK